MEDDLLFRRSMRKKGFEVMGGRREFDYNNQFNPLLVRN